MAAREAVRERADGIVLDVWLAKDGVVMTADPADLLKIEGFTGKGKAVDEWTSLELGRLDAGQGEKVPTLAEMLDTLSGLVPTFEIHLVLPRPLKNRASSVVPSQDAYNTPLIGFLAELLSSEKYFKFASRVYLQPRNRPQIDLCRSALPTIKRLLYSDDLPPDWHAYTFPSGQISGFAFTIMALPHLEPRMFPNGMRVLMGPINNPSFLDQGVRLGLAEISTGMPATVKAACEIFANQNRALAEQEEAARAPVVQQVQDVA
jgi:hypothetical protein